MMTVNSQVPLVIIDSIYYGKFVLAPLNILIYNVFGKGGPNLYGMPLYSSHLWLSVIHGFLLDRSGALAFLLCQWLS